MIIFFYASVLRHIGDGPINGFATNSLATDCQEHWYYNILYVNNYPELGDRCLGQSQDSPNSSFIDGLIEH